MTKPIKLKWKVMPQPTGPYKSFQPRGWPQAYYPDGNIAGTITNTEGQRYSPYMVRDNSHAPLKVIVYDYSEGVQKRKHYSSKNTFATVNDAKDALARIIDQNPHFVPKEELQE